ALLEREIARHGVDALAHQLPDEGEQAAALGQRQLTPAREAALSRCQRIADVGRRGQRQTPELFPACRIDEPCRVAALRRAPYAVDVHWDELTHATPHLTLVRARNQSLDLIASCDHTLLSYKSIVIPNATLGVEPPRRLIGGGFARAASR